VFKYYIMHHTGIVHYNSGVEYLLTYLRNIILIVCFCSLIISLSRKVKKKKERSAMHSECVGWPANGVASGRLLSSMVMFVLLSGMSAAAQLCTSFLVHHSTLADTRNPDRHAYSGPTKHRTGRTAYLLA